MFNCKYNCQTILNIFVFAFETGSLIGIWGFLIIGEAGSRVCQHCYCKLIPPHQSFYVDGVWQDRFCTCMAKPLLTEYLSYKPWSWPMLLLLLVRDSQSTHTWKSENSFLEQFFLSIFTCIWILNSDCKLMLQSPLLTEPSCWPQTWEFLILIMQRHTASKLTLFEKALPVPAIFNSLSCSFFTGQAGESIPFFFFLQCLTFQKTVPSALWYLLASFTL